MKISVCALSVYRDVEIFMIQQAGRPAFQKARPHMAGEYKAMNAVMSPAQMSILFWSMHRRRTFDVVRLTYGCTEMT
ncbi:MAG: hypothetical protein K2H22_02440 [Muribaculaceae bacterium]|nr:hypothetical protein [Muribaculaceae bacterium]